MFYSCSDSGYIPVLDGIQRKTLVYGEKTLMSAFHLAQDSHLPSHAHPYEQTGYLVSGHMRLRISDAWFDVRPGDSWSIPADVEHQAEVLLDSVAIEVFSPVREDYLPK